MALTQKQEYDAQRKYLSLGGILLFALGMGTLFMDLEELYGILMIALGAITISGLFFVRVAPFPIAGVMNLLNAILLGALAYNVSEMEDATYLYLFAAMTFVYLTAATIAWRNWRAKN